MEDMITMTVGRQYSKKDVLETIYDGLFPCKADTGS